MKIDTIPAETEPEEAVKDVKDENKVIKSEEKPPRSPEMSFVVGDYCLVKRPADNNWRTFLLKFDHFFLLLVRYLYKLLDVIDFEVLV